jgi:hypothetical protein
MPLPARKLTIAVQRQAQSNWCWAACTSSVAAFFDASHRLPQCELADEAHDERGCCADGDSERCNRPWYLDRALKLAGRLERKSKGPAGWPVIQAEIDAGRPVGVRIGWRGGGGHFVLITGYRALVRTPLLRVEDPWTGVSELTIGELSTRYKGNGTWTHTYTMRA